MKFIRPIWRVITEKISPVALVIVIIMFVALAGGAFGYVLWSQRTLVNLSQQNYNLSKAALISQNNHHANTVKTQAQLAEALAEANAALETVKAAAAVIEYEGGVIAYQNGEIIAAQQAGHALLLTIQAIQAEVGQDEQKLSTALTAGQQQINAFDHYALCVGENPTNPSTCGTEPPLPSTSSP